MSPETSPLTLYLNLHTLQLGGPQGWVDVSDPDCKLLRAFVQTPDQRLETPHMLEQVGKAANQSAKHALEVQIVRLRKKLEQAGAPAPTIKAVRGLGYQLCIPLLVRTDASAEKPSIFS